MKAKSVIGTESLQEIRHWKLFNTKNRIFSDKQKFSLMVVILMSMFMEGKTVGNNYCKHSDFEGSFFLSINKCSFIVVWEDFNKLFIFDLVVPINAFSQKISKPHSDKCWLRKTLKYKYFLKSVVCSDFHAGSPESVHKGAIESYVIDLWIYTGLSVFKMWGQPFYQSSHSRWKCLLACWDVFLAAILAPCKSTCLCPQTTAEDIRGSTRM